MKTCLTVCLSLWCWLWMGAAGAGACSCLPPDMGRSYENADHVVHVRIDAQIQNTATVRRYAARLLAADYKG